MLFYVVKNDNDVRQVHFTVAKKFRNVILFLVECGITDSEKTIIQYEGDCAND